jgi:hypothetical protein
MSYSGAMTHDASDIIASSVRGTYQQICFAEPMLNIAHW